MDAQIELYLRTGAEEYSRRCRVSDDEVDRAELVDIVREVSARRNGWRVILERCAQGDLY